MVITTLHSGLLTSHATYVVLILYISGGTYSLKSTRNDRFFLRNFSLQFYLFINYNTITNYILIIYELSNFDHLLGIVSQTRVFAGNWTHVPHTNSQAHYPLPGHLHGNFIYSQSFCQKSAEKKSPKKYFSYFAWDWNPGFLPIRPWRLPL